jgi:hypothetical protein
MMVLVPQGVRESSISMAYMVLASTKYTGWVIKVQAAILDAQGLWEAMASVNGVNVDEHKNKMARVQLLQALLDDILMQVSTKPTTKVWDSLKTRFISIDRVKVACLATLKGEFDRLILEDTESLDDYAGKISGMVVRYSKLGMTLDDASMVKKLLNTVPDRLYPAVADIEQFYDAETMSFEETLSRLRMFNERSWQCSQVS